MPFDEEQWVAMQNRIIALETRLQEAQQALVASRGGGASGRTDAGALTSKRSFAALKKWPGKPDEFEDWHFTMKTFLKEEVGWAELLKKVENWPECPSKHNVARIAGELFAEQAPGITIGGPEVAHMNKQLYQVLCMNLTETALTSVKNVEEELEVNGLASWWKMVQDNEHMTAQRLQGLAGKVYHPKRVKKMADVKPALEAWEVALKEYVKHEKHELSDASKIFCVRQLVPEDMERDLIRVANTLDTYKEVRSYITEQASIRKDMKASGPVPMEVDYAKGIMAMMKGEETEGSYGGHDDHGHGDEGGAGEEEHQGACGACDELSNPMKELFTMMKGWKGGNPKGFGKGGKGRFEGNCSHCGAYGHRLRECWKKDKEMNEWRATKGKGKGKGGDAWGGKGGYEPKGKGGWKGHGKGYGKNNAMSLDWYGSVAPGYGGGQAKPAWTLSLEKMTEDKWIQARKGVRAKATTTIERPPGLGNSFEVLSLQDVVEERGDYEALFPALHVKTMPKMGNYSKRQVRKSWNEEKPKRQVNEGHPKDVPKWKLKEGSHKESNEEKPTRQVDQMVKSLNIFQKVPVPIKELSPFISPTVDSEGWMKVKGVMDSGASESVAPPNMCPHYPIVPSPGSLVGQKYMSASEDLIDNLGEQNLDIVTEWGKEGQAKYQIAEVSRPLNAVSEICDGGGEQGQHVVFGKYGGVIVNPETGAQTPFSREDGVYTLEFWVKPKSGF